MCIGRTNILRMPDCPVRIILKRNLTRIVNVIIPPAPFSLDIFFLKLLLNRLQPAVCIINRPAWIREIFAVVTFLTGIGTKFSFRVKLRLFFVKPHFLIPNQRHRRKTGSEIPWLCNKGKRHFRNILIRNLRHLFSPYIIQPLLRRIACRILLTEHIAYFIFFPKRIGSTVDCVLIGTDSVVIIQPVLPPQMNDKTVLSVLPVHIILHKQITVLIIDGAVRRFLVDSLWQQIILHKHFYFACIIIIIIRGIHCICPFGIGATCTPVIYRLHTFLRRLAVPAKIRFVRRLFLRIGNRPVCKILYSAHFPLFYSHRQHGIFKIPNRPKYSFTAGRFFLPGIRLPQNVCKRIYCILAQHNSEKITAPVLL